jgi:uncharacterized NAD-dependent epimerase/dehydratase family protein
MIPKPYLLYLGNASDELAIKTSRGIAVWRPNECVGEHRGSESQLTLGLPHLGFAEAASKGARTMVLGVANAGGVMAPQLIADSLAAIQAGLNIASGLHERLRDNPQLVAAAEAASVQLFDIREPPRGIPVGNGRRRAGKRLLTVGTDCSVGKMYTSLALERELRRRGFLADFRATGQTGILIAESGAPVDAVVADFISGSVEWVSPSREDGGWDLIEGQGSLFHPSYAGVSLGLLHGAQPDALVLCHEAGRAHMRGLPHSPMPDLATCLERNLIAAQLTNPHVVAVGVALNTRTLSAAERERACGEAEDLLGLPCQDPMAMGVGRIVDRLSECFGASKAA